MKITIWGARGSIPAPIKPQQIKDKIYQALLGAKTVNLKDLEAVKTYVNKLSPLLAGTAGGNTTCIQIEAGQTTFIIDAGSGIRDLGLKLMDGPCGQGKGTIYIFFSHAHWDHIQGFPFFRPAFIPGNRIFIYSIHDLQTALTDQQRFINFPVPLSYMQADMEFRSFSVDTPLTIDGVNISALKTVHPGDAYAFRFEKDHSVFVFASDNEYKELGESHLRPYLDFFYNADVLIFDAQFTFREEINKADWGHSSSLIGAEIARLAKVKTLVLFHHDPTASDETLQQIQDVTIEYLAQDSALHVCEVLVAYEGLTFDLRQPGKPELEQFYGGQIAVLIPVKVLDQRSTDDIRNQLTPLGKSGWPPYLIVDFSKVDTLTVSGLKPFVSFKQKYETVSIVFAGLSSKIKKVIELAGFLDFFDIYNSVEEAIATIKTPNASQLTGQTIKNRYQIESEVGKGQLGTVFKAVDKTTDQIVAVKILSASFSQKSINQFLTQGQQLSNLKHANIIKVFDCDKDNEIAYVAQEFIQTKTLQDLLEEYLNKPLVPIEALDIGLHIAYALDYAHNQGVVHGDLKPKNILMSDDIKVDDFGLGHLEQGQRLLDSPVMMFTPHYLAPEQILGQNLAAATDLYALGAILYHLFTGSPPFNGSDQEIMRAHLYQAPLPPSKLNPQISRPLEHLILKLLAKKPTERYESARQVSRILSNLVINDESGPQFSILSRQNKRKLIGKETQLKTLLACWEKTQAGQGELVFITGETGIGKTHLVQEFITLIKPKTLLIGHCHKLEGSPAYQPFIEALRSYFTTTSPTLADKQMGRFLGDIASLVPEIRHIFSNLPEAPHLEPKQKQLRLMNSVSQFIKQATKENTWLLILEDFHWADQNSLQLLHYLARHASEMALFIVATYRDTDLEPDHPLPETLQSLSFHLKTPVLKLERLSQSQVEQLLKDFWGQPVPDTLVQQIYQRTEGNPFYVEEVTKGLVDESVVTLHEGKWQFLAVQEVKFPQSVKDAVLRRVNRLSRDTQTLLRQAAVLGRTFKFDDLCEMSNLSEWEILERLDVALERQLIEEAPGEPVLRFRHAEIQQVLYEDLATLRRRSFHRQAGEALERCYLPEPKPIAEQLAYHFREADEFEKTLIYSVQAARQADSAYASQTALMWYSCALDMLHQLGLDESTQHQLFDLLIARERIYNRQGMRQEQETDLEALAKLTKKLNDLNKQAKVYNLQSYYYRTVGQYSKADKKAKQALKLSRETSDAILESESLINLAYLADVQGEFQQALKYLSTAHAILEKGTEQRLKAISLQGMGKLNFNLNNYQKAEHFYNQALVLNQTIGNRRGESTCLNNLGELARVTGRYLDARSYYQQSLGIDQAIGDRPGEAICLNNLGLIHQALGDYTTAETYMTQALAISQSIDDEIAIATTLYCLSGNYQAIKHLEQAKDYADKSLEIYQRLNNKLESANVQLILGLIAEDNADYQSAYNNYDQALSNYLEVNTKIPSIDARCGLARCLLNQNSLKQTLAHIKIAIDWVENYGTKGTIYPVHFYLTVYQVFIATEQIEKAENILTQGYTLLKKQATMITDAQLKQSFWENVTVNKTLASIWFDIQKKLPS